VRRPGCLASPSSSRCSKPCSALSTRSMSFSSAGRLSSGVGNHGLTWMGAVNL
jgi:hypothetical protein